MQVSYQLLIKKAYFYHILMWNIPWLFSLTA